MTVARTGSDSLNVVQQCKWKPLDSGDEVRNDDWKDLKRADWFTSHGFTVSANSPFGHCTLSSESSNVQVRNIVDIRHNITCSTDCK
jgi:hypothetical protein